ATSTSSPGSSRRRSSPSARSSRDRRPPLHPAHAHPLCPGRGVRPRLRDVVIVFLKVALYFLLLLALTRPIGLYMRRVFCGERTFLDPLMRPAERLLYRLCGIDEKREQSWQAYTLAMLVFSAVGLLFTYAIERLQQFLPLNPDRLGAVAPALAWNTAMSFTTNTDWQAYSGESTMSHLTQMSGLTFHNFASAAAGMAIAVAVIRGIARQKSATLGNFWVDLVRGTLRILL